MFTGNIIKIRKQMTYLLSHSCLITWNIYFFKLKWRFPEFNKLLFKLCSMTNTSKWISSNKSHLSKTIIQPFMNNYFYLIHIHYSQIFFLSHKYILKYFFYLIHIFWIFLSHTYILNFFFIFWDQTIYSQTLHSP